MLVVQIGAEREALGEFPGSARAEVPVVDEIGFDAEPEFVTSIDGVADGFGDRVLSDQAEEVEKKGRPAEPAPAAGRGTIAARGRARSSRRPAK